MHDKYFTSPVKGCHPVQQSRGDCGKAAFLYALCSVIVGQHFKNLIQNSLKSNGPRGIGWSGLQLQDREEPRLPFTGSGKWFGLVYFFNYMYLHLDSDGFVKI